MLVRKRAFWIGAVVALIFMAMALVPTGHSYGAAYQSIDNDGSTPIKVGKYYFKSMYQSGSFGLYYSKSKSSGYKLIPDLSGASSMTDGKVVYGVAQKDGRFNLVRFSLAKSKSTTLKKKLPGAAITDYGEGDYYHVSYVKGKFVYLTRSSFSKWKYTTYLYNTKAKKLKKVKSKCSISCGSGKYVCAATDYQTDVSAHRRILYKITSKGSLKKVKTLAKYVMTTQKVGKNLYYLKCSDSSGSKASLYRIKFNGKKKKKLGSWKAYGQYGQVVCYNITSKNCYINGIREDGPYLYTYKTKKLKRIYQ